MINSKSIAVLDPELVPEIHLIGGGAVGSKVADLLGRLGIDKITVWDFDNVEEHNIGNQGFLMSQIGMPKAKAVAQLVNLTSGMVITPKIEKVTNHTPLKGFIFLMVDTMEARKEIFHGILEQATDELNSDGKDIHILDSRIALYELSVYHVQPSDQRSAEAYKNSLYSSSEVKEELRSACGRIQGLGSISSMTAALMVQLFIQHVQGKKIADETIINVENGLSSIQFGKPKE